VAYPTGHLVGPQFKTVNLGLLYTAKGTSAFLVPVAA
jgi:hypothetical protein